MLNTVRPEQWMHLATGHGTKGTREYDWAWLDIRADDTSDEQEAGTSVLVARRHRYTGELSYFRCWAPGPIALAMLVEIICRRWWIEETLTSPKASPASTRDRWRAWNAWMRWSLFSLIAAAVLALAAVGEKPARAVVDPADLH